MAGRFSSGSRRPPIRPRGGSDRFSSSEQKGFDQDEPPNSRLFILYSKDATIDQEGFRDQFSEFGTIEEIKVIRDRNTSEPKGYCYIKYSKTSEAAFAMEAMHGKLIKDIPRPIKVVIASFREKGVQRDETDEVERIRRLFVNLPKGTGQSELEEYFSQFGKIEFVIMPKNKETNEPKGYAFLQFTKASQAALAFENCDRSYRAKFAVPRLKRPDNSEGQGGPVVDLMQWNAGDGFQNQGGFMQNNGNFMGPPNDGFMNNSGGPHPMMGGMAPSDGQNYSQGDNSVPGGVSARLLVNVSSTITSDQLWKLFDIVPGLEHVEIVRRREGNVAKVIYNSAKAATYAFNKVQDFEFTVGQPLSIRIDSGDDNVFDQQQMPMQQHQQQMQQMPMQQQQQQMQQMQMGGPGAFPMGNMQMGGMQQGFGGAPGMMQQPGVFGNHTQQGMQGPIASLVNKFAQASSMMNQSSRFNQGGSGPQRGRSKSEMEYDKELCSVRLPPPQRMASADTDTATRLFVVGHPDIPEQSVLKDVFGRFRGLIDVRLVPGKNFGYVKYANEESAEKAKSLLHGQDVLTSRLKVMIAKPMDSDPSDNPRKRAKMEDY